MAHIKSNKLLLSVVFSSLALLGGCSDDKQDDASFSLGLSDAPVDDITDLVVCFSEVELKPTGEGEAVTFKVGEHDAVIAPNSECPDSINTTGINIKAFVGEDSESFIRNASIAPGDYKMKVKMSEGSFAVDAETGEQLPVTIPSNELKLVNTLTFAQGGEAAYTLEFDLKKSMVDAVGQEGYKLKPTGIRLVNNTEVGTLFGDVSSTFLTNNELNGCTIGHLEGEAAASVYIYEGADVSLEEMSDISDPEGSNPPYATAAVIADGAGNYSYEIGYIMANQTYTVVLTCSEDTLAENDAVFIEETQNAEILPVATTTINF